MNDGISQLRLSARSTHGPDHFCRMGLICVTRISGIGRMLLGALYDSLLKHASGRDNTRGIPIALLSR